MRELKTKRANFSLGVGIALGAGVSIFVINHPAPPSREMANNADQSHAENSPKAFGLKEETVTRSPSSVQKPFLFTAEKGTETVFRFERALNASVSGKSLLDIVYNGKLSITTLDEPTKYQYKFLGTFEFSPITLKQFPPEFTTFNQNEKTSVLFQIGADGKITSLKTAKADAPAKTPEEASLREQKSRVLLDLLSEIAFLNFEDVNGKYTADLSPRVGDTVTKAKVAYLTKEGSNFPEIKASKVEAKWEGEAFSFSRLRSLNLSETLESGDENFRMIQNSSLKLTLILHRIGVDPTSALSENGTKSWKSASFTPLYVDSNGPRTLTRPTQDWNSLSEKLLVLAKLPSAERLKTFHELVRSMSFQIGMIANLKALLLERMNDPALFKLGIGALAAVPGEPAQSALREIFRSATNDNHSSQKTMILTAFTTTPAPLTAETQKFLKTIATEPNREPASTDDSVRTSATYALGSSLQKETEAASRADTEKTLNELLAHASTLEDKKTVIDAMGNSGNPAFIPALKDYFSSPDSSLREKATFSLRFMPSIAAEPYLLSALSDPEAKVRRSALQAIRFQKNAGLDLKPYSEKLKSCAQNESSAELKSQCAALGS